MAVRITVAAILATLLVPAAASAATTVGSSLPAWTGETLECTDPSGCTIVPRTIQGRVIVAPFDGVIVRWSARMPTAADTAAIDLKPVELTTTGARTSGAPTALTPPAIGGGVVTQPARVAVSAGSLIAVDLDVGDEIGIVSHAFADSSSWSFFPPLTTDRAPDSIDSDDFELLFNATIEPDADHDRRGDETQDKCPQLASDWTRTCRGKPAVSVSAGRSGLTTVGVGNRIDIHAGIGATDETVVGARLEITLPDALKPIKLSGTPFCAISGQRVVCPASNLRPWQGQLLTVEALAQRPAVAEIHATGTTVFGGTPVTATDPIRITTEKRCGLTIRVTGRERGTPGGDRIVGGPLEDQLSGRAGADCLSGGRGDDLLGGGDGDDRADGGAGADLVRGNSGNDRVIGGSGRDRVEGGPGDDRLYAVDGTRDVVRCGPGRDRARVDRIDSVSGCERVTRRR